MFCLLSVFFELTKVEACKLALMYCLWSTKVLSAKMNCWFGIDLSKRMPFFPTDAKHVILLGMH